MTEYPGSFARAYALGSTAEAERHYDDWALRYESELSEQGYAAPARCAEALASVAVAPWAPVADLGCGTGLSGEALTEAGFSCIDGFDLSEKMLERAAEKEVYRSLERVDLAAEDFALAPDTYQNAAAVGCLNPAFMPVEVIDRVLSGLLPEGCFVFSLAHRDSVVTAFEGRVHELCDAGGALLRFREDGPHLPGLGIDSRVYVLQRS